jgi:DNA-binding FadR family transcriptional regulator
MHRLGVSRNGKRGALQKLRRAGLIAVEERARKSPIVTVRFVD